MIGHLLSIKSEKQCAKRRLYLNWLISWLMELLWIWPGVLLSIAMSRLKAQKISCKIRPKQIDDAFQMESFFTCPGMLLKQEWLLLRFISANTSIFTNTKVGMIQQQLYQHNAMQNYHSHNNSEHPEHIKITSEVAVSFGIQLTEK